MFKLKSAVLIFVAFLMGPVAFAGGSPGTWPFPWAKECPMNFDQLAGHYVFSECGCDQLEVRISKASRTGHRVVTVTRYSELGGVEASGYTTISKNQKSIRVYMRPQGDSTEPFWAEIKLHFETADEMCAENNLVPILTLTPADSSATGRAEYRLHKID